MFAVPIYTAHFDQHKTVVTQKFFYAVVENDEQYPLISEKQRLLLSCE